MLIAPRFCPFDAAALVPQRSDHPRAKCERCSYAILFIDGVWMREEPTPTQRWHFWLPALSFGLAFLLTAGLLSLTFGWP